MTINKNQRYKKDVIKDTECLKEITSLINKITDKTYTKIENDITKLVKDDHIKPFLIDVICETVFISSHLYSILCSFIENMELSKTCSETL